MDKVENEPGHLSSSGNEYAYVGYGPGQYVKRRAARKRLSCSKICPGAKKCSCTQRNCVCTVESL